jgi:regulator of protease activity HflC (stomatin/prohibitin superfamily)
MCTSPHKSVSMLLAPNENPTMAVGATSKHAAWHTSSQLGSNIKPYLLLLLYNCASQVSHAIRDALMVRAADFGIVLEDIAITHLSFGTEFTKAVEMKQVAEQDAERARFVVLKAEQVRERTFREDGNAVPRMYARAHTARHDQRRTHHECAHLSLTQLHEVLSSDKCVVSLPTRLQERNAAIIRAEGESEAAKLISDATKQAGAGLVELRRIEAAKDIAETMSKSQNVVYLPSGGNMLLGINPR